MYFYLSSKDPSPYSNNSWSSFKIKLAEQIQLSGLWWCALTEFHGYIPEGVSYIDINVDICCESFLGGLKDFTTRRVFYKKGAERGAHWEFSNKYYIPVRLKNFDTIEIKLTSGGGCLSQ